jgi:hypothetical protein
VGIGGGGVSVGRGAGVAERTQALSKMTIKAKKYSFFI